MPVYEVEKDGQIYEVEAPTPEAAARAFDPPTAAERIATQAKNASRGFSGVARAPQALVEGASQLGLDIAQAVTPDDSLIGRAIDRSESRFQQRVSEDREEAERKAPGSVDVGDVVAGLAPLPIGKLRAAKTIKGAMAKGAAEGALLANLPYQDEEGRILPTVLGGALGAIAAFPNAVHNTVGRAFQRRMDQNTNTIRAEAAEAFIDPNTRQPLKGLDDYTIAQVAGDPFLNEMANRSKNVMARDFMRKQLDQRLANFKKVMDSIQTAPLSTEARAGVLHNVVKQAHFELRTQATKKYGESIEALAKTREGVNIRVPVQPLKEAVLELEQKMGNIFGLLERVNDKQLADTIRNLQAGNVRELKLEGLVKLKQAINEGRVYGQINTDKDLLASNKVRNRMMQAIDEAVSQTPESGAYAQLRQIEKAYAMNQEGVRRVEADAIMRLFGDKAALEAGPDAMYRQFINLTPNQQKLGVDLLSKVNPDMLFFMRKQYLDDVLRQAQETARPAMASQLDTDALYKGLTSEQFLKNPLFSSQEKRWARAAAKDIRIILNNAPEVTRPGTTITPDDVSINLVSRSPEFLARLAARAVTGLKLEDVLFTPAGREALKTTANARTATTKRVSRAFAYWMGLLSEEPTPPEQQ